MATRQFTRQEVEAKNHKDDAAIIIDNVVYHVSKLLEDHPGGAEVLLDNAGKDASKCFLDVGHSEDAVQWRKLFKIGDVVEAEHWPVEKRKVAFGGGTEPLTVSAFVVAVGPPAMLALFAYVFYSYLFP